MNIPHPYDLQEADSDRVRNFMLYHQAKQLEKIADSLEESEDRE